MESTQYYISINSGVYSSWHAIGVWEDLQTNEDIAQFLMTLYSRQKQKDGEETSIRCVHCHSPLTLYCSTCQYPSQLALPTQPSCPSVSTAAPALSSHGVDTSTTLSVLTDSGDTESLTSGTPHTAVKDEEQSTDLSQDEGDHEFNDCSFDFDIKTGSTSSACGSEPKSTPLSLSLSLISTPENEREKLQKRLSKKPARNSKQGKKKKITGIVLEKAAANKLRSENRSITRKQEIEDHVKCARRARGGRPLQREDGITKQSIKSGSEGSSQKESENCCGNMNNAEKPSQVQRKRKPCASQDLEDGFILPVEKRCLAEIHVYDESFYQHHKIEDEPPKRPGRPKKNLATLVNSVRKPLERHGRKSQKRRRVTPTSANSDSNSSDEEMPDDQLFPCPEQDISALKKESTEGVQPVDTERQSFRILVSSQKILPLRTTNGNYAHNFYSYFECIHCKKAFIHKRAFNSHVQTHIEQKLYKCTLCDKGFKRSCDRIKHERRHKFECGVCGKKYTKNNELDEHMKLHTENNGIMKCSGCEFETLDFREYEKHKSKCTIVQCEICGVRLKSLFALRFHIAAIHKNDRPFKCTLCEKSFVLQTNLNSHIKYRHAEGGRSFHCDQCNYRAFDARGLSIHQRCVHSNERPFKCTYCPSAFARKFYLVIHLRKHTGEKPHRCTECSQSFAQKPSLTRHRRTHHGLEPTAYKKTAELQNSLYT